MYFKPGAKNLNPKLTKYLLLLILGLLSSTAEHSVAGRTPGCVPEKGITLQVLGSGGPVADDERASSGYLVWVDGRSRFLIDAGGGVFLRFGEAGASFADLAHIAISHFHADHSADLVALLKSGYFSARTNSLSISGPAGSGAYPGLDDYLQRLLGRNKGAYAYLAGYLDGSDGLVQLVTTEVDPQQQGASLVYQDSAAATEISALGVPHGPVPALAYRISVGDHNIVFAGDQNGSSVNFTEFAKNTDILVMHMAVPEGIMGAGGKLHAPPSIIGEIAAKTRAGKLVLSHFMARSLTTLPANLATVQSRYSGKIVIAHDLECIPLDITKQ